MINRGANTEDHWQKKHIREFGLSEPYDFSAIEQSENSYHKIAFDIIKENNSAFQRKSILEIGCAGGDFSTYIKNKLPEFQVDATDFSTVAIDAASLKSPDVNFYVSDIILNPIEKDYGVICMFETIEHLAEGINYQVLDNILDHSEYVIISTVTTPDDCFGEHISHYTFDTFDNLGYEVTWKAKLNKIDISNIGYFGNYHYVIFLIKGKL